MLKSAAKEYGQFGFLPKLPKSHAINRVHFPEQFVLIYCDGDQSRNKLKFPLSL